MPFNRGESKVDNFNPISGPVLDEHPDRGYLKEDPYGWGVTVGAVLGAVGAAVAVALAIGMLWERLA